MPATPVPPLPIQKPPSPRLPKNPEPPSSEVLVPVKSSMPLPIRSRPNNNTVGALMIGSTVSPTGPVIHACATSLIPLLSAATTSTSTESTVPSGLIAAASSPALLTSTASAALINGSRIKSVISACARGAPTPGATAATAAPAAAPRPIRRAPLSHLLRERPAIPVPTFRRSSPASTWLRSTSTARFSPATRVSKSKATVTKS